MSKLELRIPPVAVVLVTALVMWLLARASPGAPLDRTARVVATVSLLLAGAALALAGVREFRSARTTVNPLQPAQAASMVTSGVYRYSRNPMYLGMLCLIAAWAAWLGKPVALLGLPAFVLYMNRFQIEPEERALAARFGTQFSDYAGRVRRWL
jgi:protein-S-isoprenylcysteine O-methyltransferase Ste14